MQGGRQLTYQMPATAISWPEEGATERSEQRTASPLLFDAEDALDIEEEDPEDGDHLQAHRSQSAVWEREEDMEEDEYVAGNWEEDGNQAYWVEEPSSPPFSTEMEGEGQDIPNSPVEDKAGAMDQIMQQDEDQDLNTTAWRPSPPGKHLSRKIHTI